MMNHRCVACSLAALLVFACAATSFTQEPPGAGDWDEPYAETGTEPDSGDRTEPWVIPSTPGVPWSWGTGSWGQLGNGAWGSSYAPVQVSVPAGTTFQALDSGYHHGLGLTNAGTLLAWGWNSYGQVGNGNNTNQNAPVAVSVPAGTVITAIAAGAANSYAVTGTGQVLAWGAGTLGALGNGANSNSNVPVWVSLPAGATVTDVAAGDGHAIALTSDGRVLGWGFNTGGQLGDGTWTSSNVPVWASLPAGTIVTKIFSGDYQCFALTSTGAVLGWGHNAHGELGDGTNTYKNTPTPISFPAGTTITDISGGNGHSIFLTGVGTVLATGYNNVGQLGNGTGANSNVPVPVSLPAGAVITDIEANQAHCLALKSTGTVLAWGYNNGGQLGDGTNTNRPTPVDVLNLKWVLSLAAGSQSSLATVTPCQSITVANPAVTTGTVNAAFSETFTSAGGFAPVTFSTSSPLPAGLSLAADGTLSGTPTVKGTFPITVTATDSHGCTGTGPTYNLVIDCQTITVSPAVLPAGAAGTAYGPVIFSQADGVGTITWSESGALPTGMSFDPLTATLSGTPSTAGSFPITVTATDGNGCSGSQAYTLLICPVIALSPASLPDGTKGLAYSQAISASGCGGSCTFAVTAGVLPDGLSLDGGGVLSGTPTVDGTFDFTVTATDADGCTGALAYSVTIACPTVVTNLNDSGEWSLRWVVANSCAGTTITFAPGLTGVIHLTSGAIEVLQEGLTIQGPGAYQLAVDGGGLDRVLVEYAGLVVSGLTFQNGSAQDFGGGIFAYGWLDMTECVVAGNRASLGGGGVYMNDGTLTRCTISGNLVTTSGNGGGLAMANSSNLTLLNSTVSGNFCPGSGGGIALAAVGFHRVQDCTITLNTVGDPSNPGGGIEGMGIFLDLELVNSIVAGNGPAASQVYVPAYDPEGSNNLLSGDPMVAPLGDYGGPTPTHALICGSPALDAAIPGTFEATDQRLVPRPQGASADIGAFENVVTLSPSTLPDGQTGTAYSEAITASGGLGPWTFTAVGTLPPGLTLSADGQLTGTPTDLGSWTFYVVARDLYDFGGVCRYTIAVTCGTMAISPSSLSPGTLGTAYGPVTFTQSGGSGTITWGESGTLPAGMSFDAPTATLSGTPTEIGTFSITVTATDANACTGSQAYTLTIACPAITLAALTATGTANTPYSSSAAASPAGTYTYAVTAGSLPPGLTLDTSTGAVTGTPTTNGTYTFTITATGWGTCAGSQAYTVIIACPTITLAAVAATGTSNTPYSSSAAASPVGTYTYAVTAGGLPPGLTLNTSTGAVTGTPTTNGTYTFTITATGWGTCTGSQAYTVTVACPAITLAALTATGTANAPYNSSATASPAGTYTYGVTAGSLPPGLTLNTSTGAVTGTPTTNGTYTFTVTATGWGTCTSSQAYTLTIACPTITLAAVAATGTANTSYSSSAAASPAGTYTYGVTAGSLPPGLTLNTSTGAVTGTPTANGTYTFTITATGWGTCTGSQAYTLTIACPAITLAALTATGTANAPYNSSATASPAGTYTYAVTAGGLPPGLTLDPSTGAVTGTPTTNGTYTFTVTATGWGTCTSSQAYTLTIACPTITLAAVAATGTANTPYSSSAAASPAGTYTYAVTAGSLPPGLTLNTSTGAVTGTPTANGTYTFTITATGWGTCTGSQAYTVTVACPTVTLAALTATGTANTPYSSSAAASPAGTYTYAVTAGSLPPGLTLDTSTGAVTGTPTANGTYTFTITATGWGTCTGNQAYTLTVSCPTVTLAALTATGTANTPYSSSAAASPAGTYTYAVTAGSLPPGLTLNTSTGAVTGTPTTNGTYTFTITATGWGTCTGSQAYTLTIACPTITLSPASPLPGATVGSPYGLTFSASPGGTTYTYALTAGSLPPGLTLNGTTGALTGTVTAAGPYTFTVTATGWGTCTGSQVYTLSAVCSAITVGPATIPGGVVGSPYAQAFSASGDQAPYTFSIAAGTLPPGLTLSPSGALSGTPTLAGTYTFTVRATDLYLCAGTTNLTVTMVCPAIAVSPPTLSDGLVGAPYTGIFTASGGTAPYYFAVTAGALPPGVTLAPDGTLTGAPTAGGTFSFTVTATDLYGCAGSRSYTVIISTYDLTFFDDYGRSALCVNSSTGAFTYKVLNGFGLGSYSGVGVITRYNGVMYLRTPVVSPVYLNLSYLERYHRAQASFKNTPRRIASTLYDNNTLNNPAVCTP